jgi:hypothetical protein
MISVPPLDWLQRLIDKKFVTGDVSVSTYLLELVLEDLRKRKLTSLKEQALWSKPISRKGGAIKPGPHKKFSLYLPPKLDFIKTRIEGLAASRSLYVWNLFVLAHEKNLTGDQGDEWDTYCTTEHRGSPGGRKKKVA